MFQDNSSSTRISFLHNPISSSPKSSPSKLSTLLFNIQTTNATSQIRPAELLAWLDLGLDSGSSLPEGWSSGNLVFDALVKNTESNRVVMADYWKSLGHLTDKFGIERGSSAIVVNGRVSSIESKRANFLLTK